MRTSEQSNAQKAWFVWILVSLNAIALFLYFFAEKSSIYGYEFNQQWAETTPILEPTLSASLTLDLWIAFEDHPNEISTVLFSKGTHPQKSEFALFYGENRTMVWQFSNKGEVYSMSFPVMSSIPEGKWLHLTAVRDIDNQRLSVMVDGKIVAESVFSLDSGSLETHKSPFLVLGSASGGKVNAKLKEIRLWNSALSNNQIDGIFKHKKDSISTPHPVFHWKLNPTKNGFVPSNDGIRIDVELELKSARDNR